MVNNVNAEKKNNQKKIFGIESDINSNKKLILESRLLIEENKILTIILRLMQATQIWL